jgi:hypothetical protein
MCTRAAVLSANGGAESNTPYGGSRVATGIELAAFRENFPTVL